MLILGLLLAVAALVVFGFMYFGTSDLNPLQIDLGIVTVELTPLHLYLLGAATLVVLVLGLFFLTLGLRASRRRRREVKELRAAVQDGDTPPVRDGERSRGRGPARVEDPAPVDRVVPPTPRVTATGSTEPVTGEGSPRPGAGDLAGGSGPGITGPASPPENGPPSRDDRA